MNNNQILQFKGMLAVCEKIYTRAKKIDGIKVARQRTLAYILGSYRNNKNTENAKVFNELIYEYSFRGRKRQHEKKSFNKDNVRYRVIIKQANNLIFLLKSNIEIIQNELDTVKQKTSVDLLNSLLQIYEFPDDLPQETKLLMTNF